MKKFDWLIMLALFSTSFALRIFLLRGNDFDGLYGQDAYAYYDFAEALSRGNIPGGFFWPLGYPVLLASGFALSSATPIVGQLINILLSASLAPMLYALTRKAGGSVIAALIAGLLMGICGQALQSSIVLMSDIPALFWATLSAVLLLYAINSQPSHHHNSLLIFAAVALALAGITRWIYLLLAIPWLIALFIFWRGHIHWKLSAVTAAAICSIFLPQALYSHNSAAPTINHAWVQGWSPQNAFSKNFTNIDGHFQYPEINARYYAKPFYDPYYLAPFFAPFLLAGVLALWKNRAVLVLLVLWLLLPYLFLAGIPYQNIRFPLIVVPPTTVLIGLGVDFTAKHFKGRIVSIGLFGVVLLGIGLMLQIGIATTRQFITKQQRDKDAVTWVKRRVPTGSSVYTFGLTLTLRHYADFQVYELYYETPETLAAKYHPGQSDYIFVNVWNIENQWVGREPQIALHWLRDERGLTRLGKIDNYVLYRIGA